MARNFSFIQSSIQVTDTFVVHTQTVVTKVIVAAMVGERVCTGLVSSLSV